jgi:hypothetical protein
LGGSSVCFGFNRNIETLCFGIEAKQTVSKQTEKNQKNEKNRKKRKNPKFSVKIANYAPYQTVSVGLLFVLVQSKKLRFVSVFFGVSNLYQNNRNKQNCFVTNQNYPKFFEKYPNILSFKLFGWVFCLFRFNCYIETLCFGMETKQRTNQKKRKKLLKKWKNPKFSVKNSKLCSLSNCFGWSSVCFGSIKTSKLSVLV